MTSRTARSAIARPLPVADAPANRVLRDPMSMRALTHPVRISLLEALATHGALTATRAGELLGQTATTCSFHLRQLAKYGFVEEAGRGPGRERPWRLVETPIAATSAGGGPDAADAMSELGSMLLDRGVLRFRDWLSRRAGEPVEWQQAAAFHSVVVSLSAAEVELLNAEFAEIMGRYADRDSRDRDPAVRRVEIMLLAHPLPNAAV